MTNGNESAFARTASTHGPTTVSETDGLTKREYFSAMAMQGLLANGKYDQTYSDISDAVHYADALIEALNKDQP